MSKNQETNGKRRKNTKARTNKQKRNLSILAILAIIVVLVIAIIVFTNIFKDDNKKSNKNTNNSNTSSESYVEELGDGIVINKSRELNESKEVNGFTISNIQLTTKDGMTTLLADVKNDTGAKTTLKTAEITLLDNNNEELVTVKGIINEMEAGGTSKLNISMTSNYINAYDFKVIIK